MASEQSNTNEAPLHSRMSAGVVAEMQEVLRKRNIQGKVELLQEIKSDDADAANAPWVAQIQVSLPKKGTFDDPDDDTDPNSCFDGIEFNYNCFSDNPVELASMRRDLYCQFMQAIGDGACKELQNSGCSYARWQFPHEGSSRWNLQMLGGTEFRTFYLDRLQQSFLEKEKGELLLGVVVRFVFS